MEDATAIQVLVEEHLVSEPDVEGKFHRLNLFFYLDDS